MSIKTLVNMINTTTPYAWDDSMTVYEYLGKMLNVLIKLDERIPEDFETAFYERFREYTREEMQRIIDSGEFAAILDSMIVEFSPIKQEVEDARGASSTLSGRLDAMDQFSELTADKLNNSEKLFIFAQNPPAPLSPLLPSNTAEENRLALQAMVNSFDDRGGTIAFGTGVFHINSPIIFPVQTEFDKEIIPISLIGENARNAPNTNTKLINSNGGKFLDFRLGTDALTNAAVTIKNLYIESNGNEVSATDGSYGIYAYDMKGSVLENITLRFFATAIHVQHYFYYSFVRHVVCAYNDTGLYTGLFGGGGLYNCNFNNNRVNGVHCYYSGGPISFYNTYFEQNGQGLYCSNTKMVNLFGCYFENNSERAIQFGKYENMDYQTALNLYGCHLSVGYVEAIRTSGNVCVNLFSPTVHSTGTAPLVLRHSGESGVPKVVCISPILVNNQIPIVTGSAIPLSVLIDGIDGVQIPSIKLTDKILVSKTYAGAPAGTPTRRMQVYDADGVSVGFIALYN